MKVLPPRPIHSTLTEPTREWSAYCHRNKSMKFNSAVDLPVPSGEVSDSELWVGAGYNNMLDTNVASVRPFNLLQWYFDQVTLMTKERFAGTVDGKKRAERAANLAYVFNTFEPGRGCLFCLSGWKASLPFKRVFNDIGRFARHLIEWHVEEAWTFTCRKNKASGQYVCA